MANNLIYGEYVSRKNPDFYKVELGYSYLHFLGCNPVWFCRVWHKDWPNRNMTINEGWGEAYGRTKFEAYRLAVKKLNKEI